MKKVRKIIIMYNIMPVLRRNRRQHVTIIRLFVLTRNYTVVPIERIVPIIRQYLLDIRR